MPMESAQISRRDQACRPVLVLAGEIDLVVRDDLRAALRRLILDAQSPGYVDMSAVTFFDSTGVHAILDAQQLASDHHVELIVSPSPAVTRTMQLLGLGDTVQWGTPPEPSASL
jgi:anti-sigma B factor antagonist